MHHEADTKKLRHPFGCRSGDLVGEAVNRLGVVFFASLGEGLLPLGMMDGIGVILGFQGDAAAFAVFHAALSFLGEEVAGIELNAG